MRIPENPIPDNFAFDSLESWLSVRRPAGSWAEIAVIDAGVRPLLAMCDDSMQDGYGNLIARIGDSSVAFSCHTDTAGKPVPGYRPVERDGDMLAVSDGGVLGADDGTGIWLMQEMIKARKPGVYMFHRDEEIGGRGSMWIAHHAPQLLTGIDSVIALDRRSTTDVITHQATGRCCSDEFAAALCDALGGGLQPSPHGVFTDSANYIELAPECTNVSVGYYSEHSPSERQDVEYAHWLRDALLSLDTAALPIVRNPLDVDVIRWQDEGWDDELDSWVDWNDVYE